MTGVWTARFRTALAGIAMTLAGCGEPTATAPVVVGPAPQPAAVAAPIAPKRDVINPRLLRRFRPIAQTTKQAPPSTPAMVELGRMMWYETRLSRGGTTSCNSCHSLSDHGVDGQVTSTGVGGQRGRRNAPTVYNASMHLAQFWDGRARDVEEQAQGPILNPMEMAATRRGVEQTLRAIPEYRERFRAAFPDEREPVTLTNVARAIGSFERGLVTHSRWDDYLAGNEGALTDAEVHGLRVFLDVGCMGCHTGPQVGSSMFQVAGFVEPWPNQTDQGRFELTGVASDRMVFKVPTLKNVALTAPYFHDGSCNTLPEAVRLMGRHQLGLDLSEGEVAAIVAFLGALSGPTPTEYITPPLLPVAVNP